MTKPSGPPETARGRKGWKQKSNAKPNNLAMNLSPSCPKPHDTASASGNTLKERDAGCICCCQWKRVVVPFAINSCCRNAPLDIREANELPQRAESSLRLANKKVQTRQQFAHDADASALRPNTSAIAAESRSQVANSVLNCFL